MKTFNDYVSLKESMATDLGNSMVGSGGMNAELQGSYKVAMQAIEHLLSVNSAGRNRILSTLDMMAQEDQTLQQLLRDNNMKSFSQADFRSNVKRAAQKGNRVITKGLGDVSTQDADHDNVVAPSVADSHTGTW